MSNTLKKKNISSKTCIWLLFILPLIMILALEMMQRGDLTLLFQWIWENKAHFIINYILALALYFLSFSAFNSWILGTFTSTALLSLFSVINIYKSYFLGEPFYPWDVFLCRNVFEFLKEILKEIGYKHIVLLLAIPAIMYFIKRLISFNLRLKAKSRIVIAICSLSIILAFSFIGRTPLYKALSATVNFERIAWEQNLNKEQNGALASFIMNVEFAFVNAPLGYNEDMVIEAVERISDRALSMEEKEVFIKPDIVVIMSEALWDPTQIKSASFSRDPIPLIRELQSGVLVSPEFGGGTANVEFEFLTGFSTVFHPQGSIAYQQYIHRPIPSLAMLLSRHGYQTTAIHPNHKWFYRRDKVYESLGFNEFYGIEHFDKEDIRGEYISDMAVSERIINHLENSARPSFVFAVTIQNHGPYGESRYEHVEDMEDITVDAPIQGELLKTLEVYTKGTWDTDQSIKMLIEYFERTEKPTIFAFFGDHLPYLGADYGVYQGLGYLEDSNSRYWSLDEYMNMRSTPLLVWTNYTEEKYELGQISPNFLRQRLLEIAGIKMPTFERFLEIIYEYMPVYSSNVKLDSYGNLIKEAKGMEELLDDYWIIQYDQLFGKQYSRKLFED